MRRVVPVVVLLVAAAGLPATAVPAPPPASSWWIHRTAPAPVAFRMRITTKVRSTSTGNDGTLLTLKVVPPEIGKSISDHGIGGQGRELGVRAYGSLAPLDTPCADVCEFADGTGAFDGWATEERTPLPSEWYVGADNLDVSITVSAGWRVDRIPNVFTVLRGERSQATGARTNNVTVERFSHAEARGGRYGSLAFATIPCTSAGVGSATLSGGYSWFDGGPIPPLTCDGVYEHALSDAMAYGRTTWRLDGDATGWSTWPERLVVFSLPHPPRG